MTVKEIAKEMKVSESTVRRYIKYGKNGVRLNVNSKHPVTDFLSQVYYTKTGEQSVKALELTADEYQI